MTFVFVLIVVQLLIIARGNGDGEFVSISKALVSLALKDELGGIHGLFAGLAPTYVCHVTKGNDK